MINVPRKASVHQELRAVPSTIQTKKKRRKEEDPALKRENKHSKGDGKGDIKGTEPNVPVRQERQTSRYAAIFRRSSAKNNPHAMMGTHQNAHTKKPKVDANGGGGGGGGGGGVGDTCVFKHTSKAFEDKNGNATLATSLEEIRTQYDLF